MGIAPPVTYDDDPLLPDHPLVYSAWELFMTLHAERDYTDMGQPKPITSIAVRRHARALGRRLTSFHNRSVKRLDWEYRSVVAERQTQESATASAKPLDGASRG